MPLVIRKSARMSFAPTLGVLQRSDCEDLPENRFVALRQFGRVARLSKAALTHVARPRIPIRCAECPPFAGMGDPAAQRTSAAPPVGCVHRALHRSHLERV